MVSRNCTHNMEDKHNEKTQKTYTYLMWFGQCDIHFWTEKNIVLFQIKCFTVYINRTEKICILKYIIAPKLEKKM